MRERQRERERERERERAEGERERAEGERTADRQRELGGGRRGFRYSAMPFRFIRLRGKRNNNRNCLQCMYDNWCCKFHPLHQQAVWLFSQPSVV